jgi:equilibrative nucleoside transporter 1/2/3
MAGGDVEATTALLPPPAGSEEVERAPPPEDWLVVGYLIFFTLGAGFLLPWNAYITAVDYFSYPYPGAPVDRVFSVSYMLSCLLRLLLIVLTFPKSSARARINTGLSLFTLALLVVPVMDVVYVRGTPRLYGSERYMHAVNAGTAAGELRRGLGELS